MIAGRWKTRHLFVSVLLSVMKEIELRLLVTEFVLFSSKEEMTGKCSFIVPTLVSFFEVSFL